MEKSDQRNALRVSASTLLCGTRRAFRLLTSFSISVNPPMLAFNFITAYSGLTYSLGVCAKAMD